MKSDYDDMLDEFGKVMEQLIRDNKVQLLCESEENSDDWTFQTNIDSLGPVVQFFVLLKCLPLVFKEFKDILDEKLTEHFIDETLKMVKEEIMETVGKEAADA